MLNEAETRAEYIDPALKAAGWGVVEGSRILREFQITQGRLEGQGRRTKAERVDYVLIYRNTKLGTIEAKRWDAPYTEGVGQAKKYAAKLSVRFTYSTNGQAIYGIDMTEGAEGDVARYPTPEELWNQTFAEQNEWRDRFAAIPYEDKGGAWAARYYQDIAVERVLEAVAAKKDRILLTLATQSSPHLVTDRSKRYGTRLRPPLMRDGAYECLHSKLAALVALLRQLGTAIQAAADASPANAASIIQGAGVAVRKTPAHAARAFTAEQGAVSGSVKVTAVVAAPRAAYDWEYSVDGGKTWVPTPTTIQAKTTITGLPVGTTVQFRYRASTKTGAGDWSQPASLLVK